MPTHHLSKRAERGYTIVMPDFNLEEAKRYQNELVEKARLIRDELQKEVIDYYYADQVDDEQDAADNLRGLHKYFKDLYRKLDRILSDIESRVRVDD